MIQVSPCKVSRSSVEGYTGSGKDVVKEKTVQDSSRVTTTPKKRADRSLLSPEKGVAESPAARRRSNQPKLLAVVKNVHESPQRSDRFSSPGTSQNSAASPRVSTAHAEQASQIFIYFDIGKYNV